MSANDSDGQRFVCACGAAFATLPAILAHYGGLHARITQPEPEPESQPLRRSPELISEGVELVAEGATVAEAAEAVGIPKGTLQWHVSQRGGVGALRRVEA